MAESLRYYWIKLRTNFFNQDTIDFLLSQKNGCEYVVLYQMLCLSSANNNGELSTKIGEIIVPYTIDKIVRDTKYFDFDTVTIAIELFKKLGLVYESDGNGILTIANHDSMVGSETEFAIKKRDYRERKALGAENTKLISEKADNVSDNVSDNVRQEIRVKRLDNRDYNINNISPDFQKKSAIKTEIESEFEQIWKLYPRKEEKKRALSAYVKARTKKENPCTFEQVLAGVERYRKHTANKESQYIKTGATWFNGECWNDEYSAPTATEKTDDPDIEKYKCLINKF